MRLSCSDAMPAPAKLEVARENLATRLDDLLDCLRAAGRIEVQAAAVDGISRHYRQLAIACLLFEANTDTFFRYLCASGLACADLLERVPWSSVVDFQYLCASMALPFFDAVAAGDRETASRIARASRATWSSEDEDEVDFLRMRFLMGRLVPGRDGVPSQDVLLASLARRADPSEAPRTAVCLALHERNGDGFEKAMVALTEALDAEWGEEQKNPNRDPDQILTESYVSVEGLALVRLGRSAGLVDRDELALVPSLALVEPPPPLRPLDAWKRGV